MRHVILGSIVLSILMLASHGFAGQVEPVISGKHMKISGVVSKVQAGSVFIATARGRVTLSPAGDLKTLKVGEAVNVWINERTTVIAVRPVGAEMQGGKRTHKQSNGHISMDGTATDPGLTF